MTVTVGPADRSAAAPPRDRQANWQGLGDGLSQAVEMAVTPVLFALIGLFIDDRVGTTAIFALAFAIFAMVANFVKAYYVYLYKSQQQEDKQPWAKPRR
jgi:F0F1-type ATP synthase assembly protein I